MAYLPPAGLRYITDYKKSYLPTMTEIENPMYTAKMIDSMRNAPKRILANNQISPLKKAHSEIAFRPSRKHDFYSETPQLRPFCLGSPTYRYKTYDVKAHCGSTKPDPRELPYGLPPETFDVKIRTNWFDYWKEENIKYTGVFRLWENRFGDKYLYPIPKAGEPKRYNC